MSKFDRMHMLHTKGDGELTGNTTTADIDGMVAKAADVGHLVIHMHGGLVDRDNAIDKGNRLIPKYKEAGAYPIVLIWESGLLETLTANWQEVFDEGMFQILLKKVTKWAIGKLGKHHGVRAAGGLTTPGDRDVSIELAKARNNALPYGSFEVSEQITELTNEEEEAFLRDLERDPDFREEAQAIFQGITPQHEQQITGRKGVVVTHRISARSLMSPAVLDELKAENAKDGAKGLFSSLSLLRHAARVLIRVVKRYVKKRQHVGVFTTVVEEIYREFYLANIGSAVWNMMKTDTRDAYENVNGSPARGGWYLMNAIGAKLRKTPFRVSVVCHSTGAIYACHMLNYARTAIQAGTVPTSFILDNLIFLAPAVDFRLFASTLAQTKSHIQRFRMFALSEKEETNYWEVPVLYKGSLLYIVSGLFEKEPDDDAKSAFDRPIVGMQRYFTETSVYRQDEVKTIRSYVQQQEQGAVWSTDLDGPIDCRADARKHGEFDGTTDKHVTMESVCAMLSAV